MPDIIKSPVVKFAQQLSTKKGRAQTYPAGALNTRFLILSAAFIIACGIFASLFIGSGPGTVYVILAAIAGSYMALNIGANDVANNVSPAFGSGALTLVSAIILAAIFEAAGALIASGNVVSTISKSIIDASMISQTHVFITVMVSALFAGAIWLNLATWVGAPVSTTHSIVGAVLGGGIAAVGFGAVHWDVMSKIAASWVISPLLGGIIAAVFLTLIEKTIFSKRDMLAASRRWVPVLLGVMAAAFSMYLVMKGLKKIIKLDMTTVSMIGGVAFLATSFITRPFVNRASGKLENHRRGVNKLFTIPLIFATALLSFAHGANDVANAIGPLSAVVSAVSNDAIGAKAAIPFWVMGIGALGIVIGLALFGSKLIRKVGKHLTTLDQSRAYCICLSAAITVIAASTLGLPVSSTHIAIGAVFGIGFTREFTMNKKIKYSNDGNSRAPRRLVRRKELLTIASAWVVTVPSAAVLAALIFNILILVNGGVS
ncbi:MAG TPA: inorganic phosphate transporter [Hellea balneolensis]|uniref:Phosphate transporter n=1 Tax=Hellea balneolensis TaxID=287478 RepID=A0A7C3C9X7_9PROT|nr:inorganic phosphate transporter [Hellea balneolensis]